MAAYLLSFEGCCTIGRQIFLKCSANGNQRLTHISEVVINAKIATGFAFGTFNLTLPIDALFVEAQFAHGYYKIFNFETNSVLDSINYMISYCIYI